MMGLVLAFLLGCFAALLLLYSAVKSRTFVVLMLARCLGRMCTNPVPTEFLFEVLEYVPHTCRELACRVVSSYVVLIYGIERFQSFSAELVGRSLRRAA